MFVSCVVLANFLHLTPYSFQFSDLFFVVVDVLCSLHLRGQLNIGRTALIFAAENGHTDCVRLLLDAGAKKIAKSKVRVLTHPLCGIEKYRGFFVGSCDVC